MAARSSWKSEAAAILLNRLVRVKNSAKDSVEANFQKGTRAEHQYPKPNQAGGEPPPLRSDCGIFGNADRREPVVAIVLFAAG